MNIVSVFEVLLVSLSRSLKTINNMKNSGFTFRKRLASFRYAFNGIRLLIQKEHNAWIHCFAKDLAAGAVLIMAIAAAIVGSIIFFPKLGF